MKQALGLFTSPRFLPIFIVQFGGALNDNLFKSAMLILVAFQLTDAASQASTINNLAALLFILPYFFLSPLAGQFGDRGNKAEMIQYNKIAEITIAVAGAAVLYSQSISLMLFILFALGAQSSMFGPNKYAILPQLMHGRTLITGNALIASGTFVAILSGTLIGGILAQQETAWVWVGTGCIITAIIGYIAARNLPQTEIGNPELKVDWNIFNQIKVLLGLAKQNQRVWTAIMGVSWFWFTGTAYLTQIPTVVRYIGGGDESVVTLFLALFISGIGIGCAFAAWISHAKPELGLSPIALLFTALAGLNLAFVDPQASTTLISASEFLQSPSGLRISVDILLIGIFGGAFALPLYIEMQQSSRDENRARIISFNNVLNAVFMVVSSVIAILILGILKFELSTYLLVAALLNVLFALYLHLKLQVRTFRLLAQIFSRLFYKIDAREIVRLPEEGGALLVCNHVSYADPVIIFGASKRPIRFIMDKAIRNTPLINYVFKASRTLPICSPLQDRQTYEETIAEAVKSLQNGELVMIFPEGRLSPDGEIAPFKRGIEKLLDAHPVPVYPMAIRGVWGSYFSHGSGPALKSGFNLRLRRRKIQLLVDSPLQAEEVSAAELQEIIEGLRGPHQ